MNRLFLALLVICIAAGRPAPTPAGAQEPEIISGRAVALDGDTLLVFDAAAAARHPKAAITPETLKVRLFGIDAPEMRGWPLGAHARAEMDKLVPAAGVARVTCRVLDRDSHGRPVALCAAGLHRDLGAAMIAAGGAVPHRLYLHGPDAPVGLAARYDAAEAEARAARRGIWLDYYGD